MTSKLDRLMREAEDIKDPAVAVHLARIEGRLDGMKVSNDNLGKTLETVVLELREVSKISQRYTIHDDSVKRIWEEIDKRDKKWDERFEVLSNGHGGTKDKVNKIFYFSAGVSAVGTTLLAVILWIVVKEMDKTTDAEVRLRAVENHLIADPIRPLRPK